MLKSIKVIIAGILTVPVLALGMILTVPATVSANPADCSSSSSSFSVKTGAACAQGTGQAENLFGNGGLFSKITNAALYLIGAISVLMLIYGGIRYTISGGDSTAVTNAKNTILYAIVGIVVAILAYAIVNFVITSLPA